MIEAGASASLSFIVDESSTAIALGSGDVPVLGTPKVIALCEQAACAAIAGALGDGSTSVGTHIGVDHLAPTALGAEVVAHATLIQVDGRRLSFSVSVTDGETTVAKGTHHRVIVDRAGFLASIETV